VKTVVFGASDPAAGAGGSVYNILEDGKLGHRVEVIAGIMETECADILTNFFGDRR
jgi:tRNA(adenine34) deaminase